MKKCMELTVEGRRTGERPRRAKLESVEWICPNLRSTKKMSLIERN